MDFELKYSPEQEAFRKEVRAFLEANIPPDLEEPVDPADLSYEQYLMRRELGRKLGERGWLFPTFPKEYGGGGLPMEGHQGEGHEGRLVGPGMVEDPAGKDRGQHPDTADGVDHAPQRGVAAPTEEFPDQGPVDGPHALAGGVDHHEN